MDTLNLDTIINVADIVSESVVDGIGFRMTLFVQGCNHRCEGCHNATTWNFDGGKQLSVKKITDFFKLNPLLDGMTFSGGEPFEQAGQLSVLAEWLHAGGHNVWCYSGYTLQELLVKAKSEEGVDALLSKVDVLVDGRFEIAQKNLMLKFRGSNNQRIIDLVKTRQNGYKEIIWVKDMQ